MVGTVRTLTAGAFRAETVAIAVLVVDIGTFQIIGNEDLLRTRRDCKTVRGKLDRPYSGVASETSPEKVIVAGDFVADDIRVNGVRNVLGIGTILKGAPAA